MNRILLIALAIAAVPALVGAQTAKKAIKAEKPMTCAVMPSNKVDIANATKKHMYADYKGRRYFFCCNGCPQTFKKNPAKYAKAASIAIPKAPAAAKKPAKA